MPIDLSSAEIVDLSVTLSERLPATWPGHALYAHQNWNWYAEVDGPNGRTKSVAPYQTNVLISAHDGVPVHREGLSRRLRYVEALTNLDRRPPRGAWFQFLPIKVGESSGGPGRAIALL